MRRAAEGQAGLSIGDLAAGLASAALAAVASRPWGLGALALVAYVPAFVAVLRSRRSSGGALVAAAASLGVASVGYEAAAGIFPGAYLVALLLGLLPYALIGAVAVRFNRSAVVARLPAAWRTPVVATGLGLLWCAAEFVPGRPELFGVWAFPLGAIGYSQLGLPSAQLARFSAVTAVSAFVLLVNSAGVLLWQVLRHPLWQQPRHAVRWPSEPPTVARSVRGARSFWAALGLLAVLTGWVVAADVGPGSARASEGRGITVRLVQPNSPDSVYAAAAAVSAVADELEASLSTQVKAVEPGSAAADLTLLPEAWWPGVLRPEQPTTLARSLAADRPVLFGAVTAGWFAAEGSDERRANSVMLFAGGRLTHVYDKRRLVPIVEARLRAGSGPRLVDIGGIAVAPLVCYDAVFPADVRAAARLGADLLTVHTDDSFAARSDVPALHLRVAAMRAIETGLPLALVSNTGPSALVSASGQVLASTRPLETTVLTATLSTVGGPTPYVSYGDWVGGTALALSLGIAALSVAGGGAPELDQGPT